MTQYLQADRKQDRWVSQVGRLRGEQKINQTIMVSDFCQLISNNHGIIVTQGHYNLSLLSVCPILGVLCTLSFARLFIHLIHSFVCVLAQNITISATFLEFLIPIKLDEQQKFSKYLYTPPFIFHLNSPNTFFSFYISFLFSYN